MAVKKGGLGRGLDSLFNENATEENGVLKLNLNDIEPNREQPRKTFDDDAVSELADSIAQHGLIQPIVVAPLSNGRYSIVAGERRWRAARIAGLSEVPVIIKELTELGKSKGSLSNKDILDAIGEIDFEPEQLEKLYDALESAINEKTKAIIPVDLAGIPCDYDRIFEIVNNKINVVAVDGFRLAWSSSFLEKNCNDFKAVIPGKTLNEVNKIKNPIKLYEFISKSDILDDFFLSSSFTTQCSISTG